MGGLCSALPPSLFIMTATATMHTILGVEFELDELRDIVNHGMSAGVSGFIYYHETTVTSSMSMMMRFRDYLLTGCMLTMAVMSHHLAYFAPT